MDQEDGDDRKGWFLRKGMIVKDRSGGKG